jgi:hypothetical protein
MRLPRHIHVRTTLAAVLFSAATLLASAPPAAQAVVSDYGIESVGASLSTTQAGKHPDFTTTINLKTDPTAPPDEFGNQPTYANTKDIAVELPPGLVGNPNAVAQCTLLQFATTFGGGAGCPQDSQVGITRFRVFGDPITLTEPIFNLEPPSGDPNKVARLGFYALSLPILINVRVRSESDYGLTAELNAVPSGAKLLTATTTLWGVPADPSHDTQRLTSLEGWPESLSESPPRKSGLAPAPFMTNPTSCQGPLHVGFAADSYALPEDASTASAVLPEITGCGLVAFDPSLAVTPTSQKAAAPTGLDATLHIPQDETVNGLATSQLRDAVVTLPEGMTIASGAADGLQGCSAEQVGIGVPDQAANCPDASKIGSAEFDVPALSRTLHGAVYQRTPEPGNLFRIWLVADELGVHVKIGGEVRPDPVTGQITSIFAETPQVPLEEFRLHFKGGPRAVLANPSICGTYFTHSKLTPWSGSTPVIGESPMTIDQSCDTGAFAPKISGGSTNPVAGSFSSVVLDLTREDGEQNVARLDVTTPPGLLGKLAGIPLCPAAQAEIGACGASSQVGTTAVAAGPGPSPLWIPQPGKDPTAVFLSGPYEGAPYSFVVKTPAQAGPFDLGNVVVRAGIFVDPDTARVTVKSDPLPQILEGVPVFYRTIHVDLDRPDFTLNPTSCDPMSLRGTITSSQGAVADASDRFQVGGCANLGFKPHLATRLFGPTRRGAHPSLRATLITHPGEANIGRAAVTLPPAEFLDQGHIRTVCTRVQFAASECPEASIYGHARAVTPLLDQPLEGPIYLRSSSHELPDLVAALSGQVKFNLVGRIDSVKRGGIRTTFESVPDAPVSKFVLSMQGGAKGLLVNSTNICTRGGRLLARFDGQNGKIYDSKSPLKNSCGTAGRRAGHSRQRVKHASP